MSERTRLKVGDIFGTRTVMGICGKYNNHNIYLLTCKCGVSVRKTAKEARIARQCENCRPSRRIGKETGDLTWLESFSPTQGKFMCVCGCIFVGCSRRKRCPSPEHLTPQESKQKERVSQKVNAFKIIGFKSSRQRAGGKSLYICRCSCGKECEIETSHIDRRKSCGCLNTKHKARGEEVASSKYTSPQLKAAVEFWLTGSYTIAEIGDMCYIHIKTLYDVLNGNRWRHLKIDPKTFEASPGHEEFLKKQQKKRPKRERSRKQSP